MRFTQHYAGAASCHPARCVLFTGKHTEKAFIRGNSKIPLRSEEYTLPQVMKEADYALDFIRRHRDEPFFFYGAFTVPHAEVTVPEAFGERHGVSILPTLLGEADRQEQREIFYWEAAPQQALRRGDWKAYRPAQSKPLELYHLAEDIGESEDLAEEKPELAAEFARLMESARSDSEEFPLEKKRRGKKK